jgi:hypothetical protein
MSKEVIAIKIPASTAASRKKLVKNVDQIEKTFSKKMIKFQTSQYVKAIEAAEEKFAIFGRFGRRMGGEKLGRACHFDVWKDDKKRRNGIEVEFGEIEIEIRFLSKKAESKRHELLGTKPTKKKKI